ncbi:MAG: 30S ribosomal protein S6 [Armatimonadota bacterium]|jgi:ribosomal protein S6
MSEPTLYEAIYILDASLPDEETEQIIEFFETAVEEAGGEMVGTRDFRTRRLAYPIDKHTHGTYKLLYFFGTGAVVDELRQEMSIRQQVIRSRIFVANPHAIIGGLEPEEAEEAAAAAAESAEAAEAEAVEAEAAEAEEVAEEVAEEAAPEAAEAVETDEAPAEETEAGEAEEVEESEESGESAAENEASEAEEATETEE